MRLDDTETERGLQIHPTDHISPERSTTQDLILSLFGLFALDREVNAAFEMALIVRLLEQLSISEGAVRVTLHRMVKRGVLDRRRQGRSSAFFLTEDGVALLARGRKRVFSSDPFVQQGAGWTLLTTMPPSASDRARYHFQTRLQWAGFGAVDTRVWLAPGRVDVAELMKDVLPQSELQEMCVLHGEIVAPSQLERLIARAWNTADIQAAHLRFLAEWEERPVSSPALPDLLLLVQQWTGLVLDDPGLPGSVLDPQWPAPRSTATFYRLFPLLREKADDEFARRLTEAV